MNYEKIIKKENGDKIKISVSFWICIDKPRYDISLYICHANKRKFNRIEHTEYDTVYRALSLEERRNFMDKIYLKYVSESEILEAKKELWNLLKPF